MKEPGRNASIGGASTYALLASYLVAFIRHLCRADVIFKKKKADTTLWLIQNRWTLRHPIRGVEQIRWISHISTCQLTSYYI